MPPPSAPQGAAPGRVEGSGGERGERPAAAPFMGRQRTGGRVLLAGRRVRVRAATGRHGPQHRRGTSDGPQRPAVGVFAERCSRIANRAQGGTGRKSRPTPRRRRPAPKNYAGSGCYIRFRAVNAGRSWYRLTPDNGSYRASLPIWPVSSPTAASPSIANGDTRRRRNAIQAVCLSTVFAFRRPGPASPAAAAHSLRPRAARRMTPDNRLGISALPARAPRGIKSAAAMHPIPSIRDAVAGRAAPRRFAAPADARRSG